MTASTVASLLCMVVYKEGYARLTRNASQRHMTEVSLRRRAVDNDCHKSDFSRTASCYPRRRPSRK